MFTPIDIKPPFLKGVSARERLRIIRDSMKEDENEQSTPMTEDLPTTKKQTDEEETLDSIIGDIPSTGNPHTTTTASTPNEEVIPDHIPQPKPVGRPPLPDNVRKWPKLPAKNMDWKTLDEWAKPLRKEQWAHFDAYLYRLFPVIFRETKYIDTYPGTESEGKDSKFTLENIKHTHGGGKYKLHIRDCDIQQEVAYVRFEIPIADCEPKLNLMELDTNHKLNRAYVDHLIRRGALNHDGSVREGNMAQGQSTGNIAEVLTAVKGFMDMGGNKDTSMVPIVTKMLEGMIAQNHNKPDEIVKLTQLLTLVNANKSKEDGTNELLLKLLISSQEKADRAQERFDNMMLKFMEKSNTPVTTATATPVDPLENIERTLNVIDRLKGANNNNDEDNPQTRGRKPTTLETILDKLPAFFTPIGSLLGALIMSKSGMTPEQIAQMGGGMPATIPTVNVNGAPQPPQTGVVPYDQNQTTTNVNLTPQQVEMIVKTYGQQLINAVFTGKHGAEYADSLVNVMGEEQFIKNFAILARIGVPKLVGMLKTVPTFWNVMAPKEQQFVEFLTDFIGWPDTLPGEDDGVDEKEDEDILSDGRSMGPVIPMEPMTTPITKATAKTRTKKVQ